MASLSSPPAGSKWTVKASVQVRPPSKERLTTMAVCRPAPFSPSATWCTVPSAAMDTQGSLARSYAPPAHFENFARDGDQVMPPSKDTAEAVPLEPPFDQRSCCQAPTRWSGFLG